MLVFTKETARRALRTFFQAFFASVIGTTSLVDTTDATAFKRSALFCVIVPAIAAGFSAVMNLETEADEN